MGDKLSAWLGSAACKDADPALFSINEREGGSRDQSFRVENEARLELGLEYCKRCPVVRECGDTASPMDYQYTIRGGRSPYSEARPVTAAAKAAAETAWEGYRRGEKTRDLGGTSWTWFKGLREAHMASTPEISWPTYRTKTGTRGYQFAGTGVPLSHSEEDNSYVVLMVGGTRNMRRTIEAEHVSWDVPVGE